ncbi:unnamed protein product [Schistosoma rodhaini]|uniref:Nuclear pore complex protein Nup214 n=1 Tax=Schistosoma mansoni TaxID=6183 RepID=A0A3Q0KJH8_SCHMA|nr:hypothetical protein Smp_096210 [Schistosoma mansoni]CAH8662099.1 unnamed protein product [Schistosoma rodhaini]|eukprot:XP_018644423.1 hypothetical protein Smp_096210 [Schistosoma mansoni]
MMNRCGNLKERVHVLQQELEKKRLLLQKAEKKLKSTFTTQPSILLPVTEETSEIVPECSGVTDVKLFRSIESPVQGVLIQPTSEECCRHIALCVLGSCILLSDSLLITLYDSNHMLTLYSISLCNYESRLLWEKKLSISEVTLLEIIIPPGSSDKETVHIGVLLAEKHSPKNLPVLLLSLFMFSIPIVFSFTVDNNLNHPCLTDVQTVPVINTNFNTDRTCSSGIVYEFYVNRKNDLMFVLYVPDMLSYTIHQLSYDGKLCLVPLLCRCDAMDAPEPKFNSWFTALSHCSEKPSSLSQSVCILGIHFNPSSIELVGCLMRTNDSGKHIVGEYVSERFTFSKLAQNMYLDAPVKPCSKLLVVASERPNFLVFSVIVKGCLLNSCTYYFTMGVVSMNGKPRGSVVRLIPIHVDLQDVYGSELAWSLFTPQNRPYSQCLLRFVAPCTEQRNLIISAWSVNKLITGCYDKTSSNEVVKVSCFSLSEVNKTLNLIILYNSDCIFPKQICTFYYSRNLNKIVQLHSS